MNTRGKSGEQNNSDEYEHLLLACVVARWRQVFVVFQCNFPARISNPYTFRDKLFEQVIETRNETSTWRACVKSSARNQVYIWNDSGLTTTRTSGNACPLIPPS